MSRGFHHTLRPNEKNERPQRVIFYDVESRYPAGARGVQPFTPFLWTAIYKRYRSDRAEGERIETWGESPLQLWDFVEDRCKGKTTLYMLSHHLEPDFFPMNGAKELTERGWSLEKFIQNGRVVMFTWKKETQKLIVMNSGNLFPGSIEQWGRLFGFPKLEQPAQSASLEDWRPYCARDTQILERMFDLLIEFMNTHDLGNFKLTISGIAKTAYQHRFMDTEICIHADPDVIELERRAYRGGRCQALKPGNWQGSDVFQVDANGMYGAILMQQALPYRLRNHIHNPPPKQVLHLLRSYAVVAEIEIDLPEPVFMGTVNGKTRYLTGPQTLCLCTPELEYVQTKGWPFRCLQASYYDRGPIFRRYATFFYDLKAQYRQQGNRAMELLAKQFPNSLYGKFGQKGHHDEVIGECDPEDIHYEQVFQPQTGKEYGLFFYGGRIHKVWDEGNARDSFVAIAAHVTAHGRMMLWRWMQTAGLDNVYAVATDSLKTNAEGYRRLGPYLDPLKPGYLKLEGSAQDYVLYGPNDSYFDGHLTCKGVPKGAEPAGPDSYWVTVWPHAKSLLKNDQQAGYATRVVKKTLAREDYKKALDPAYVTAEERALQRKGARGTQAFSDPEIHELQQRLNSIQQQRLMPSRAVMRYWDYKANRLRRLRGPDNALHKVNSLTLRIDGECLGFADWTRFVMSLPVQAELDRQAREVKSQVKQRLAVVLGPGPGTAAV